jgi:hypothetical protein
MRLAEKLDWKGLNTLFSLKLKIVVGWSIHVSKCGVHEMMIGWEIYIAFFCRHITVSVNVLCSCCVLQYLCSISKREHTSSSGCMTVPVCMWSVVLTHTRALFHILRWGLPPLMSQTFQCVTCHVFQPSREH